MCMCKTCTCNGQPRCPYQNKEVPVEIQKNGCSKYIKKSKPFNSTGMKTKCIQCRYLFRKKREEYRDKSFIVCGCLPSQTQRIAPVTCCPNYKPLRKKQMQKRFAHSVKPPYPPKRGNGGRGDLPMPPRDNRQARQSYQYRPNQGRRDDGQYRGGNGYRG